MARCGCAGGACSCLLVAGANVTITGNGSSGLPYTVSAASTGLSVTSTAAITLSLIGTDLTASLVLDPTFGNLLVATSTGLRLDCAAISGCGGGGATHLTVADSGTIDFSVAGDGSVGTPFVVSGVVIADGTQGIKVGAGGVAVKVSTDAQNEVTIGTDGGVFSPNATSAVGSNIGTPPAGTNPIPAPPTVIDNPGVTVVNPSASRSASVMLTYIYDLNVNLATGQGILIALGGTDSVPYLFVNTGVATQVYIPQVSFNDIQTLAAGATATFTTPMEISSAGFPGGTYAPGQWRVTYLLVTV